METTSSKTYYNITRDMFKLFQQYSEELQGKLVKQKNHGDNIKTIKSEEFMDRWQIDLIDYRTLPDGEYSWICNVQVHFTKFCWLKPLKEKSAVGVANVLNELFGIYGAPLILQSDNGREFRNHLLSDLQKLWPNLKIIDGRPRHPQSQGSIQRANGDVQNILGSWMRTRLNTKWTTALPYVQFIKNSKHHHRLGVSPYKAIFGIDAPLGLEKLNYEKSIIENIHTIHDLCKILGMHYFFLIN